MAAVAYVDPGNVATNVAGGAASGYQLLWVIVMANLMAMLIQYLAARAGLATGRSLPELCRERYGAGVNIALRLQARRGHRPHPRSAPPSRCCSSRATAAR